MTIWHDTYQWLLANAPSDTVFLSYEAFCDDTEVVWKKMKSMFDIREDNTQNYLDIKMSEEHVINNINAGDIGNSENLYNILCDKMNEIIYH